MSNYKIIKGHLSATIVSLGGEWVSFKNKEEEFVWQGIPTIWNGHAPYLFPNVGKIKDDHLSYDGNEYQLPKHGFARKMEFSFVEKKEDLLILKLASSPETLSMFPFSFELKSEYRLTEKSFINKITVKNTDQKDMIFGFGFHPGFNLPDFPVSQPWILEFEKTENADAYRLNDSLLTIVPDPAGFLKNRFPITDNTFNNDAYIYKNILSRKVLLKNSEGKTRLQFSWKGCNSLGIWAKPGAPYVCIEPWAGYNDSPSAEKELGKKAQFMSLKPGTEIGFEYEVEIF